MMTVYLPRVWNYRSLLLRDTFCSSCDAAIDTLRDKAPENFSVMN